MVRVRVTVRFRVRNGARFSGEGGAGDGGGGHGGGEAVEVMTAEVVEAQVGLGLGLTSSMAFSNSGFERSLSPFPSIPLKTSSS